MTDKRTEERCKETTADGSKCQGHRLANSEFCPFHDPTYARARAEGRRAGGIERSRKAVLLPADKPDLRLRTIADLVELQELTMNGLLRGKVPPRLATTIFYGASVLASLIQRGSLEDRLSAIESIVSRPRPSSAMALEGNLDDMEFEVEQRDPGQGDRQGKRIGSGSQEQPEGLGVESQQKTSKEGADGHSTDDAPDRQN